jgi:hypothetical protein
MPRPIAELRPEICKPFGEVMAMIHGPATAAAKIRRLHQGCPGAFSQAWVEAAVAQTGAE